MPRPTVTPQEFLEAIRRYAVLKNIPLEAAGIINAVPIEWAEGQPQRLYDQISFSFGYVVNGETVGCNGCETPMKVRIYSFPWEHLKDKGFDQVRLAWVLLHELAHAGMNNADDDEHGHGVLWAQLARSLGIDEKAYSQKPPGSEGKFRWLDHKFEAYARDKFIVKF